MLEPSPTASEVMTPAQAALWSRIEGHDFEPASHSLTFTRRLARDHGWSMEEARAVIGAYRRFCFLAMITPTPVTPSEAVDEAWHQHLVYSRDYWDVWCGQVLGKPLHHDPTPGGPEAQLLYRRQYAETLALHERFFGPPDPAIWPATHERFRNMPRYHVIDVTRSMVLPRPRSLVARLFSRET